MQPKEGKCKQTSEVKLQAGHKWNLKFFPYSVFFLKEKTADKVILAFT